MGAPIHFPITAPALPAAVRSRHPIDRKMDLADIPAAAAFLGAELPSASAAESARLASSSATTRQHCSGSVSMDHPATTTATSSAATAATLLNSAHFYHADANAASMAQHYYAQNLASFANVAAMPFIPMYGLFPAPSASFLGPPHSATFLGSAGIGHGGAPPFYDLDASVLQNQIAAQFTQATPQQQRTYYEDIRQQLDTAASGLNEDQKQALLRIDPSLSFSMKPLELDTNANVDDSTPPSTTMRTPKSSGGVKRARTGSSAGTPSGTKKPKKNKALSCEPGAAADVFYGTSLLNEDSLDCSSSSTTPRGTPRGRPPSAAARAASAAGVLLTPSGKKLSMTPQAEEMRARKAKMTWPKGTFLVRLQDVRVRNGRDHIWLVDNHQLLQRYNNESGGIRADGSRVYHKTDRYTGWLCHEGFHYFPLFDQKHVLRTDGDTVTVLFPDETDLQQALDYQEQENARRAECTVEEKPNIRPLPPSIRNQPAQHQLQMQQQRGAHSTLSTTSTMSMRSQMPGGGGGGGEMQMMMRSGGYPGFSTSPSCSMTMAGGDHQLPSTSRGFGTRMMPSLSRQDFWGRKEGEDEMGDVIDEGRRRCKQEDAPYEEYGDLADMVFSGMP